MKRSEVKRRPLADTVLATLEPEGKVYRVLDGDGLYFRVKPSGAKSWELRYKTPAGKWSWYGIGSYTELSGAKAREEAVRIRALIRDGVDPLQRRRELEAAKSESMTNTFARAAEYWYQRKVDAGRAPKTLTGMRLALDNDLLPAIGMRPIESLTHADCSKIQERIEARGAYNTAEKVRVWLRDIFGVAMAKGWCRHNPATEMHRVAAEGPKETQYPHLYESELPDFLRALSGSRSRLIATTATWMTLYTASRPGIVRMAEWSELDLDNALWSVPAEKMKMRRPHLVPLPVQVVDLLRELHRATGQGRWVFPSTGPKLPYISDATINKCIAMIGYKGRLTGHGSRHTFKTLVSEHGWNEKWSDRHLAHLKKGEEKTYNKAEHLGARRIMTQWYADYLDALEAGITDEQRAEFAQRVADAHSNNVVEMVKRA